MWPLSEMSDAGDRSEATVDTVVVSYNTRACLERCLGHLPEGEHRVLVVDSASTDRSVELVRERFPKVELVVMKENRGFGSAANEGIRRLQGRYALLLNADAWPRSGAIESLVAAAELDPSSGIVAPRLVNTDGSSQRSVFGYPRGPLSLAFWAAAPGAVSMAFRGWRRLQSLASPRTGESQLIDGDDFPAGAALLLRMDAFAEVDGFDESFFMYSEETDLCHRIRQRGWRILLCPEAVFVHVGAASTGLAADQSFREQLRSYLRFFAKYGGKRKAERARVLLTRTYWLRSLALAGRARSRSRYLKQWLSSGELETLLG
jgi:N-acetylglucosaminyl-diphospho-decaprenol L-rhamnosyltransferase